MSASSKNHSVVVAAALVAGALFGLASPAAASDRNNQAVLTSRLPWLAPVGHHQPMQADVPQTGLLSSWEREQQALDVELDRKLVICRGC